MYCGAIGRGDEMSKFFDISISNCSTTDRSELRDYGGKCFFVKLGKVIVELWVTKRVD